jgi:hypothetical protein
MEVLNLYTSVLAVFGAALVVAAAGIAKKQLISKRPVPVRVRNRRRQS